MNKIVKFTTTTFNAYLYSNLLILNGIKICIAAPLMLGDQIQINCFWNIKLLMFKYRQIKNRQFSVSILPLTLTILELSRIATVKVRGSEQRLSAK